MLEGREISVLNFSEILKDNFDLFRLEAEYFQKEYLIVENKFYSSNSIQSVGAKISCGPFGSNLLDTLYKENGVLVVRPFNLKNCKVENENLVYIDKEDLEKNNLKIFNEWTLLFSRVGDIKVGVLNKKEATISPNIIAAQLNNDVLAMFLCVFYHTYYGFKQIQRQLKVAAQPTISTEIIGKLKFPNVTFYFQKQISELLEKSFDLDSTSQSLYTEAEDLLLNELGLQDFKPSQDSVNVKSFKDSFGSSGRLDAEYYQLKYEDYINLIKKHPNGFESIDKACNLKDKNYNPETDFIYKYIELSNIGNSGEITGYTEEYGKKLPSRARRKVNTNDVIISSVEGSLQSCAVVTEQFNNALCSTGFYVINSEIINPQTLLVLFKTDLLQNILKQNCSGTILTAISKSDFQSIVIPLIKTSTQDQISDLIRESFQLRAESEHLLEVAKSAVEIAIEENEEKAMDYINSQKTF